MSSICVLITKCVNLRKLGITLVTWCFFLIIILTKLAFEFQVLRKRGAFEVGIF